jgi:hypothetical protein
VVGLTRKCLLSSSRNIIVLRDFLQICIKFGLSPKMPDILYVTYLLIYAEIHCIDYAQFLCRAAFYDFSAISFLIFCFNFFLAIFWQEQITQFSDKFVSKSARGGDKLSHILKKCENKVLRSNPGGGGGGRREENRKNNGEGNH